MRADNFWFRTFFASVCVRVPTPYILSPSLSHTHTRVFIALIAALLHLHRAFKHAIISSMALWILTISYSPPKGGPNGWRNIPFWAKIFFLGCLVLSRNIFLGLPGFEQKYFFLLPGFEQKNCPKETIPQSWLPPAHIRGPPESPLNWELNYLNI